MLKVGSKISKATCVILTIVLIAFFYSLSLKSGLRIPWHQQIFISLLTPFQKSINFVGDGISGMWNIYVNLVHTSKENSHFKKLVSEQGMRLNEMEEIRRENDRLRSLLDFKEGHSLSGIGAKVIANDPRGDFRVLVVDRGEKDGVNVDQAVVGSDGLVGRVVEVSRSSSKVLLIIDPNSAVDVKVGRSRVRALLSGGLLDTKIRPSFYMGRLEYLNRKSDILEEDTLVTTGLDGVYPPGIPVGKVKKLENDASGIFKDAEVVPFIDFGNLEEVMIVSEN